MSGRMLKNNSKAKRAAFLSRVSERTRSKREAFDKIHLGGPSSSAPTRKRVTKHESDDDEDDRFGYFTPPEDDYSNRGSDSEDTVKMISEAEFKKRKPQSKKADIFVRDLSSEDLSGSFPSDDSDGDSSFAETGGRGDKDLIRRKPRFVSKKGSWISREKGRRASTSAPRGRKKKVTSLRDDSSILSISSGDSSTHSDKEIDSGFKEASLDLPSTDNDSDDESFEVEEVVCKPEETELECSSFAEKSDKREGSSGSRKRDVSELPPRKRRLSYDDGPSKQTEVRKKQKIREVPEETEEEEEEEEEEELQKSRNLNSKNEAQTQHVQAESEKKKKADSPSLSNQDDIEEEDDEEDIVENEYAEGETQEEEPVENSKQVPEPKYDLCRMFADSMLGRGPGIETNGIDEEEEEENRRPAPEAETEVAYPLKFIGFPDEIPKKPEKTEEEKELEGLFDELVFGWTSGEDLRSFTTPEVDKEKELPDEVNESNFSRCNRGKHELVWIDDRGIVCIHCHHVELGPKDVLPPWAESTCREYGQKRSSNSDTDEPLEFDGLHLNPLNESSSDVGNGTVWSIKPSIRGSMYPHQQEGFEFLWKNLAGSIILEEVKGSTPCSEVGGCIISHAPGTGKTRLTIVFIETYMKVFPNCRPVVIAPAGMLMTWEEEFKKWNVGYHFLNLNSTDLDKDKTKAVRHLTGSRRLNTETARMLNLYLWSRGQTVLGISYSLFEKLTGEKTGPNGEDMRRILLEKPGLLILDEGHTPRNNKSNIWIALLKMKTEKRVILSGTPFQNNFSELFNTLTIVRPAIADSLVHEKKLAKKRKYNSNVLSEVDDRAVEKLKEVMRPFVHVHKGTILQKSLPGLTDCAVLLKPPALQKSLIERFEGNPNTFQFDHKSALLSVHPYLLRHIETTDEEKIGIDLDAVDASKLNPNEGVKTKFILEFIRLCMPMKEKVLVFSQFIQPLELIKEQLKDVFKWAEGKQILRMEGKLDQRQRQKLINHFNDPHHMSRVMLASTRCCSEGISLVGASRVILLDVVWNPSVERQAISRAYRIGQKKFVYTYHLMTLGTTEADKYCRQAEKERLSELVFTSSSNEANKQTLPCLGIEDRILEAMVDHASLKEMFEKIINQPKDTNLIQTIGINS